METGKNQGLGKLLHAALSKTAREGAYIGPVVTDLPFTFIEGDLDLQRAAEAFLVAARSYTAK